MLRVICLVVALIPSLVAAQDMPLFTWAKNGEGWKLWPEAASTLPLPPPVKKSKAANTRIVTDSLTQQEFEWIGDLATDPTQNPTAAVASKDGGTMFVGFSDRNAVWAYQIRGQQLVNGSPYAPLRIRQGYDNSKEALAKLKQSPPTTAVTSLTRDRAGRIYAATPLGVQVFDPTGRLSGVLPLPEPGEPTTLGWSRESKNILLLSLNQKLWGRELLTSRD